MKTPGSFFVLVTSSKRLELVAAALAMTESMSVYVINEFASKILFFDAEDFDAEDAESHQGCYTFEIFLYQNSLQL